MTAHSEPLMREPIRLTDAERQELLRKHVDWELEEELRPRHRWLMERCSRLIDEQWRLLRFQIKLIEERNAWRRAFWWCFGLLALNAAAWTFLIYPALVRLI